MKLTHNYFALFAVFILLSELLRAADGTPDTLSEQPESITSEFQYINETAFNLSGGEKTGAANINFFSCAIGANLEKLAGLKEAKFYTRVIYKNGGMPNELFGTLQGVSNLESANIFALQDCWIEKEFGDNTAVLFGIHDLNTEFDVKSSAVLFTQPSHAIGSEFAMNGMNGPSIYPYSSLALRFRYDPVKNLRIKFAAFDGVPNIERKFTEIKLSKDEGALLAAEIVVRTADTGFSGIGGWYFSGKTTTVNAGTPPADNELQTGSSGIYCYYDNPELLQINQMKLGGYARFGVANALFSKLHYYFGCGSILQNVFSEGDIAGISFAAAKLNPEYSAIEALQRYESSIELSYKREIFRWFQAQPSVLYVINPAGGQNIPNAFGVNIRLIAVF